MSAVHDRLVASTQNRPFTLTNLREAQDAATGSVLIESLPSGRLRQGKLNRALNVIEGTTLIGPLSSNGTNRKRRYSEAALKKIAAMAEGLPGYLNHTRPEDAFKPRDVRDLAVRHRNVRFDAATQTVRSDMHVVPAHADLVFGLAEQFGDHIGNSLVSRGAIQMEGDTEVVVDIMQLRSADLVTDPASTKGLFEGKESIGLPDLLVKVASQSTEQRLQEARHLLVFGPRFARLVDGAAHRQLLQAAGQGH